MRVAFIIVHKNSIRHKIDPKHDSIILIHLGLEYCPALDSVEI